MISAATARKVVLSMPEAEERQHHGHPDFRVKNKILATLWPKQHRAVINVSLAEQKDLLESEPDAFSTNAWSHHGWTNVHLPRVTEEHFRTLVENSWRRVASKRLVAQHDERKRE